MDLPHFAGLGGETAGGDRIVIIVMSKAFGLTIRRAPDLSS